MHYDCLIIDDEKMLADSTAEYFNLFGVSTAVVYSAGQCRAFYRENSASLLLLDINLGDGSGFALDDKIIALNIGGDDYIQKPYSLGVLLAKVKVVLNRFGKLESEPGGKSDSKYVDNRLTVDFDMRQVLVEGESVKLT